jgi:acetyltransferase-like isoleucine patch superfamily enzyme
MPFIPVTAAVEQLLNGRRVFDVPRPGVRRWRVGERLFLQPGAQIEPYVHIFRGETLPASMGAFSYSHSALVTHAFIGRYCSFGAELSWMGGEHPARWATTSPIAYDPTPLQGVKAFFDDVGAEYARRDWSEPPPWRVEIGHDVWIGDGVMLAPHVKIGHGAVIGARSLVREDVPPYAIVVGSPARILRYRFPEPLIERLLALQWWRWTPDVLQKAAIDQPERFVDELPEIVERLGAREIRPVRLTGHELIKASQAPAQA